MISTKFSIINQLCIPLHYNFPWLNHLLPTVSCSCWLTTINQLNQRLGAHPAIHPTNIPPVLQRLRALGPRPRQSIHSKLCSLRIVVHDRRFEGRWMIGRLQGKYSNVVVRWLVSCTLRWDFFQKYIYSISIYIHVSWNCLGGTLLWEVFSQILFFQERKNSSRKKHPSWFAHLSLPAQAANTLTTTATTTSTFSFKRHIHLKSLKCKAPRIFRSLTKPCFNNSRKTIFKGGTPWVTQIFNSTVCFGGLVLSPKFL